METSCPARPSLPHPCAAPLYRIPSHHPFPAPLCRTLLGMLTRWKAPEHAASYPECSSTSQCRIIIQVVFANAPAGLRVFARRLLWNSLPGDRPFSRGERKLHGFPPRPGPRPSHPCQRTAPQDGAGCGRRMRAYAVIDERPGAAPSSQAVRRRVAPIERRLMIRRGRVNQRPSTTEGADTKDASRSFQSGRSIGEPITKWKLLRPDRGLSFR
jgi:hypothetical protein